MDVGPSTERKHTWINPDDDKVEYATLNHQLVQTENQPGCNLSTVGESQVKYNNNNHFNTKICLKINSLI